jgi:hypothetical protein
LAIDKEGEDKSDLRVNGDEQFKDAQQGTDLINADRIDAFVGSLSEGEMKVLATQIARKIPQAEAKKSIVTEAIKSAPAAAQNGIAAEAVRVAPP